MQKNLIPLVAVIGLAFGTVHARSIKGTVWCSSDPECGADMVPGPERLAGVTVSLCDSAGTAIEENGEPLTATTDENGNYAFSNLIRFGISVFTVKVGDYDGKSLGSINCLNTRNDPDLCTPETDELFLDVCGDKDVTAGSIAVDTDFGNCNSNRQRHRLRILRRTQDGSLLLRRRNVRRPDRRRVRSCWRYPPGRRYGVRHNRMRTAA